MSAGRHASPEGTRSARPRAAKGARSSKTSRAPQGSRRGAAVLAAVCALALAAGFLLQSLLPAPVGAAVEERVSASAVRISEVMTANESAFAGEDGRYSDWVEVVNTGATDVSLKGYTLLNADDALKPLSFPEITLAPGEYLLIYCDGTLKNAAGYALHAPFRLSASGVGLGLFDAEGARVDSVDVPALERNCVYRRDQQTGAWGESGDYTPGLANTAQSHLSLEERATDSPLVISEAASANRTYAPSAGGECYDYIELYNASAQAVDISGYSLSDDPTDPRKYVFPEGACVPAGGYLLVYASGLADGPAGELHAPFKLAAQGESVLLCDRAGRAVSLVELPALLSDQAYSLGEDGEYTADLAPTPGLANTSGEPRAQIARENAGGVYISEFMASPDEQPYDWLEVYNASSQAVDVSGWGLSDDAASPRKYRFPQGTLIQPGDYLTIYLSGTEGVDTNGVLNASFRLSADGGYGLTLSDASGALLDRVFVPEQYTGISYARMEGGEFLYAAEDTPDRANTANGYHGRVEKPAFSVHGGPQAAGTTLSVELSAAPGARIYYTLDCSAPDETSTPYTGPISVAGTTIVRAIAYLDGYLPSYSASESYLYDADHTMRVVSMVADPDDIFGPEGFHTLYSEDLERPGHIEVYTEDGAQMVSENCALRLHGQGSRSMDQKGFKVIARGEYGANRFQAPLFTRRDYTEYQSFLLRSSSEDGPMTRMRDSILTSLARDTGVLYQETELCVLYINGEYWGHYNMRERICAAMICQYEGWEGQEDEIDIVKGNDQVLRGSNASFAAMLDYLRQNGVPDDETLARVGEEIDLDSFIAYQALQIFVGNADTLNVKRYRNLSADGKWHWAIFDLDWGFFVDTDSIRRWLEPEGMGARLATDNTLFRALMANATFRDRFLTFMGEKMATNWTSSNIEAMIRERYEALLPEMPRQLERWGPSRDVFERCVAELVEYTRTRPRKLIGYFREELQMSSEDMEHYFGAAMRRIEEDEAAWA